jgi:hypothetical protein
MTPKEAGLRDKMLKLWMKELRASRRKRDIEFQKYL